MKNVLILKAGEASESVRGSHGDYDVWFIRMLAPAGHRLEVVPAHLGAPLPRARDYDVILMTGSPKSVIQLESWMRPAGEFLVEAADQGVPVLGVCFGHQLIAHVLGARVRRSTVGREIGTVRCTLTPEGRTDPLFDGVEDTFEVQATHEDLVDEAPDGLCVLASNGHTRNQAFRAGPLLRGVQFHPEADHETMRGLVSSRAERLREDARRLGRNPDEWLQRIHSGVRPTPAGRRILENFLQRFT